MAFYSDAPILSSSDDRLGRSAYAAALANQLRSMPLERGAVVGLLGPWGSGKTSILNMVRECLDDDPSVVVLQFNPWMFSGTEQLFGRFFHELAAQLLEQPRQSLLDVATLIDRFGEDVGSIIGGGAIAKVGSKTGAGLLRRFGRAHPASATAQREKLHKALSESTVRFVVIIDDLDRLQPDEVTDMLRLVRLTADFPNIAYVLAFDRAAIESALAKRGFDGAAYLEKIVEITHSVPLSHHPDLIGMLLEGLNDTLSTLHGLGPFNSERWRAVLSQVVRPLITSVRDVNRYLNGLTVTLSVIGDEVALEDVLALEAVRVLRPRAFSHLSHCMEGLTTTRRMGEGFSENWLREQREAIKRFVTHDGTPAAELLALIRLLFPAGRHFLDGGPYGQSYLPGWREQRLVAHPVILQYYLYQRTPPSETPLSHEEAVPLALADPSLLESLLKSVSPSMFDSTIRELEAYVSKISPESVGQVVIILMNQWPYLREQSRGMFDPGSGTILAGLVKDILAEVQSPDRVVEVVKTVLPAVSTLSAKLRLVRLVGHDMNWGYGLVSEADAETLGTDVREQILAASVERLARERDLVFLVAWCMDGVESAREHFDLALDNDEFLVRLLRSSMSESHSHTAGEPEVKVEQRLAWDWLTELFDEERLVSRINQLVESTSPEDLDSRDALTVETAARYAGGWRPGL